MSRWTPGPWEILTAVIDESKRVWIIDRNGKAIATVHNLEACEANARLIPLLEAWHSQQEQTSLTLRVLSREMHELRDLVANGGAPSSDVRAP